ncbi:MAG: helix-turn-helix domain-containing protein [Gaiellaceae bacterium]
MFEIGNSLREARVRQGLDHAQVELATKIRSKYIRALEDEQFTILPAETYVRGFLRSYAEFLGLDGQLYADEYSMRYAAGDEEAGTPRRVPSNRSHREYAIERRVVVLALVGIVAATALVFVAWRFGGGDTGTAIPAVLTTAPPVELQLSGVGRGSYVEVRRDSATGRIVLEATVPRGKVERVAGSRFWLYVQRPAGVRVELGGRPVALPARRNLRVTVTPSRTALAGG